MTAWELVESHRGAIARCADARLNGHSVLGVDGDDIAQSVAVELAGHPEPTLPLACTVARRMAINEVRRATRQRAAIRLEMECHAMAEMPLLSDRESELVRLSRNGVPDPIIAERMHCSSRTLGRLRSRIRTAIIAGVTAIVSACATWLGATAHYAGVVESAGDRYHHDAVLELERLNEAASIRYAQTH